MSLLNPLIEHYVLHEKTWKSDGGEIYNLQGEKIGLMKRKLISARAEIKLMNSDRSEICTISRKLVIDRVIYDVKTPDGDLIGRSKIPMTTLRKSIDMYDSNGKMICKAYGSVAKWNFVLTDPDDKEKVYAEIRRSNKWRDVFPPTFEFKNCYVIHILDSNVQRLMLLAYAVIIDNVYHDK